MDDDAEEEKEPPPIGRWTATSSYDIYMVDTPKEGEGIRQQRIIPPRRNPSTDVSGAALNPATARIEILAQEIITPQKVPKKTPSSTIQRRRRQKQALTRGRQTKRSRMIITYIPPETRQASTTTNSSCLRIPSNKSVSDAG